MDMREDRQRDDKRHHDEVGAENRESIDGTAGPRMPVPETLPDKDADEFDMFAENDDDMFADEPAKQDSQELNVRVEKPAMPASTAKELDVGMLDNWDDIEGYYKVILGELLNGRYHVQANLGRGMFSGVVRAVDNTTQKVVAIKLIRNNETM